MFKKCTCEMYLATDSFRNKLKNLSKVKFLDFNGNLYRKAFQYF